MTIQLSERPIEAMITLLKANMATELATIVTERGDGITLTAPVDPTEYHNHSKSEITDGDTHIEVFESEEPPFRDAPSDSANNRVSTSFEIIVRITVFNREAVTTNVMATKMRRLVTAVVNIVKANILLGAGPEVQHVFVSRFATPSVLDDESEESYQKVRGSVIYDVLMEEVGA